MGVLLLCPELKFLKTLMSTSNERVRRFFGEVDFDLINAAKDATVERLNDIAQIPNTLLNVTRKNYPHSTNTDSMAEDYSLTVRHYLELYIDSRANDIIISPLRSMVVINDPEQELQKLFKELVD